MPTPISAGLLMYRVNVTIQYFLVHPGGPFYTRRNEGVWSIPKGLVDGDEDLLITAIREFREETGLVATPPFHSLGTCTLKSRKVVHAWAFAGEWHEHEGISSNTFELEWPPRSGKRIQVPEVDKACWFTLDDAKVMINAQQAVFLDRANAIIQATHLNP